MRELNKQDAEVVWTSPTDPRTRIVRVAADHFQMQQLYDTPGSQIWCDEVPRHPDDGEDEIDHPDVFDELVLAALRAPPPEPRPAPSGRPDEET